MKVEVQTTEGPKTVNVCDYCRTVICPGRFCSGDCARWGEYAQVAGTMLDIEIGKELKLHDEGIALLLSGHTKAKKLRISVRRLTPKERRVKVKRLTKRRKKA